MGRRYAWPVALAASVLATGAAAQDRPVDPPPPAGPILPAVERACSEAPGDAEIVVCGRREEPRSPYRLPPPPERFDPATEVDSVSRERNGLLDYGDSGIHSCSTVGPGGYTGCTFKQWKRDREQFGKKQPRPRRPS